MADDQPPDSLEPVSVEQDGIILSGVGVSEQSLQDTIDARAPAETETPDAPAEVPAADPAQPPVPRDESGKFTKPSRGQRRFDELTKQRTEAETARQAAETRARELEAKLQQFEQAARAPEPRRVEPAPPPPPAPTAPRKLTDYVAQVGTTYPTYEDAVEAYTADFTDAQIRDRIEADRASRGFQSHVEQIFSEGRKAFPDFDTIVTASKVPFPDAVRVRIANAPDAHALVYALAKDDALAQRIAAIRDPFELGIALARIGVPVAVASPASTAPVVSQAPIPYQPVGSGSKTAVPTLSELAASGGDEYDQSGYRERRRAERQQTRR